MNHFSSFDTCTPYIEAHPVLHNPNKASARTTNSWQLSSYDDCTRIAPSSTNTIKLRIQHPSITFPPITLILPRLDPPQTPPELHPNPYPANEKSEFLEPARDQPCPGHREKASPAEQEHPITRPAAAKHVFNKKIKRRAALKLNFPSGDRSRAAESTAGNHIWRNPVAAALFIPAKFRCREKCHGSCRVSSQKSEDFPRRVWVIARRAAARNCNPSTLFSFRRDSICGPIGRLSAPGN